MMFETLESVAIEVDNEELAEQLLALNHPGSPETPDSRGRFTAAPTPRSAHHKRQESMIRVQTRLPKEHLAAIAVDITRDLVGKPTFNQLAYWSVRHIGNRSRTYSSVFSSAH
ncbi:hypothetical protein [Mycobacterium sp. SMC-4]|uniref:hypothetical protein n=1 Tax=Mycobacterium sp. SMC-4 TaxID=2857059 RepID=UPI0021B1E906|nr:hypothetical protein [Mycobacterium sp. SMC-4]UXA19087.1 hypothetical protein KXD98_05390 [Mycobacterium sp. SMC-4]